MYRKRTMFLPVYSVAAVLYLQSVLHVMGTAVAQWLRCCATNRKVVASIPAGVIGFFFDIKSFRSHYGSGVDSASNRNEYQEYFLEVKGGRCVRLTTYDNPVPLSRNQGTLASWNLLGLSRLLMGLLFFFATCNVISHIAYKAPNISTVRSTCAVPIRLFSLVPPFRLCCLHIFRKICN